MMLEPGETEVPLVGKPMLILCAKHVVVKAASNAAIVNFIVLVAIGESLQLLPLYKENLDASEHRIDGDVITFLRY
jgi:hypothetical protein